MSQGRLHAAIAGSMTTLTLHPDREPASAQASLPRAGGAARLLLVEDDPFNQMLGCALLQALGHEVDTAADGEQAIALCLAHDYDLVLMDCLMPVLDGRDATRRLREAGYTRPVVALTAASTERELQTCLTAGMNDCLTKPIDRGRLAAVLSAWLDAPIDPDALN